MKILRIKALNINSLKGNIDIDFNEFLKDNALFTITGPTGSGKSTILDIITCSMYGRTARLANPNELMSRHTWQSYCEVEFEIKGNIYRSSWTQKRARKSADGKFQTAKMELVDLKTDKVIVTGVREVPKHIEELSGLDFDRFAQSMMLAQGSFDAFLKAKESDRSTLLEKITGTQIYAKISKEIFDKYSFYKNDIESDKKLMDSIELLDVIEVSDKTRILEDNKKEKNEIDTQEKELNQIKKWIETLAQLKQDTLKCDELFVTISKEKEDKKEDFSKLDLANKALNVQTTYDKKNTLETNLQKDEKTFTELLTDLKKLKEELSLCEGHYETSKIETLKIKKEFDENSIKIKEIRTLKTQINEKEKNLLDLQDRIKNTSEEQITYQKKLDEINIDYKRVEKDIESSLTYLEKNKKDEKLLESFISIQKDIKEYENENKSLAKIVLEKEQLSLAKTTKNSTHTLLNNELKELQVLFDLKNKEYKKVDETSSNDTKNEPNYREKFHTLKSLLKDYIEYETLQVNIHKEEQEKLLNTKEIKHLKESIASKETILSELKTHIGTLREKRDTELLIVKYEDDRQKLKEGDECFLCGSTEHPYITTLTSVDIDKTNILIDEKESAYTKNENECKILETKHTQTESKLISNILELLKLNEQLESKKKIFNKEAIILNDDTKLNLDEQLKLIEINLEQISVRREAKEKLLKQRENAQENHTSKYTIFTQSQKELDKIIINQEQNTKEESHVILKINELKTQLTSELKCFDIVFDENNYLNLLENLNQRKQSFLEHQRNLKEQEKKRNSYDLANTENKTKLELFSNTLVIYEETRVSLETYIRNINEEAIEILNVADINMYELQIKNSFEKVQKIENNLSQELATLTANIGSLQKQQKALEEEISKNKDILKELKVTLQEELASNHFDDINSFENALLSKEQREELSQKCKAIDAEYNKYKTLKIDTSNKLLEHKKEPPLYNSLEEIVKELEELKSKNDELQQNIGAVTQALKTNEQNRQKHQSNINLLEKKQETLKIWTKLNEMVGSADGNKFAKFAQGITLDQLINLANNHLQILTSRYELQRSAEQKQLLEIEVRDSFQGDVIRPVSTLSGGESFIVSLALALGLSELASQKISIDSLFLDEGFGTLDTDSLETALNALNRLQSSGKMVGVISHVEALKERIPLQIKVVPRGDGTSFVEM